MTLSVSVLERTGGFLTNANLDVGGHDVIFKCPVVGCPWVDVSHVGVLDYPVKSDVTIRRFEIHLKHFHPDLAKH